MLLWIRQQSMQIGFTNSEWKKIELVSEEALVNIILHAYQSKGGQVELEVHGFADSIEIVIKDQGKDFNPFLGEKPLDPEAPLEKRDVGGLGVFLIRQYMDEVSYVRKGSSNILTLKKRKR